MDLVVNRTKIIDIDLIEANAWNPNVQTDHIFQKEINSIKRFGLVVPILVRPKGDKFEIIDGEHRYKALRALNCDKALVYELDATEVDAQQLTVIMNEIRGRADHVKLSHLFKNLSEHLSMFELTEVMPYSEIEIKNMIAQTDVDWDSISSSLGGTGEGKEEEGDWATINLRVPVAIKEQFDEQMDRIKKLLHPDDELKTISHVMPLEAMIQVIAQAEDAEIMGQ